MVTGRAGRCSQKLVNIAMTSLVTSHAPNLVALCKSAINSRRSFLRSRFAVSDCGTEAVRRVLDWAGAVGNKEQRIILQTLRAFQNLGMTKSLKIVIIFTIASLGITSQQSLRNHSFDS
jgi:hypothetical protein